MVPNAHRNKEYIQQVISRVLLNIEEGTRTLKDSATLLRISHHVLQLRARILRHLRLEPDPRRVN